MLPTPPIQNGRPGMAPGPTPPAAGHPPMQQQPGGAPPRPGVPAQAAPPGGGQGQVAQVPPQFARHIDPNNRVQMLLLQRIDKLSPQDGEALQTIPPQALAVLKKVIPEVGFLIDMIGKPQGGGDPMQRGEMTPPNGAATAPGGAQAAAPAQPQPPGGVPRPGTRLQSM